MSPVFMEQGRVLSVGGKAVMGELSCCDECDPCDGGWLVHAVGASRGIVVATGEMYPTLSRSVNVCFDRIRSDCPCSGEAPYGYWQCRVPVGAGSRVIMDLVINTEPPYRIRLVVVYGCTEGVFVAGPVALPCGQYCNSTPHYHPGDQIPVADHWLWGAISGTETGYFVVEPQP